jgi:hypothetical protein
VKHLISLKNLLLEHNDEHMTKQMISLLDIILQQNYFSFQNNFYQPNKGIAMGSPISGIIAEIVLQFHENTHLNQLLDEKSIVSILDMSMTFLLSITQTGPHPKKNL